MNGIQASDTGSICPYCGKDWVVTDSGTGERFCKGCGFVIDEGGEYSDAGWHMFSKEEYDKSRTGAPTSLAVHDMGLATVIGYENADASGRPLSVLMKTRMNRLRTWDSRSQVHESLDRNFRHAFSELDKLKDKLALPDAVKEKAAYIYRKAMGSEVVRGRSIAGMIAAALYAACRESETPRTLTDVADGINIKRKEVSQCYRLLLRELVITVPVADPIKCLPRIANNCNLNEKIKRGALIILNDATKMEISAGKDPMGLAAAALYLSCVINGSRTTQKVIASAAGVTEVTIRNRCKGLRESLRIPVGN